MICGAYWRFNDIALLEEKMNIGENIREHRIALGMTQEVLAKKLCVSSQAVSKWETGKSCPDVSLIPTLSEAFNISADALLGKAKCDLKQTTGSISCFLELDRGFGEAFAHGEERLDLFRCLSNEQTMKAISFLFSKKAKYSFDKASLRKKLSYTDSEVDVVIEDILALKVVREEHVNINDESKAIYEYVPMPALLAALILAEQTFYSKNQ